MQRLRLRALRSRGHPGGEPTGAVRGALGHCLTLGLEVRGALPREAVQAALRAVVARHPALRAEFLPGADHHIIRDATQVVFERRLVAGPSADKRWETAMTEAWAESSRPFDPSRPPLVRAVLLEADWRRSLLVLSFDHLVIDAWSAGLVVDELVTAADHAVRGRPLPPVEPSTGYARMRLAAQAWLAGAEGADAVRRRTRALHGHHHRLPLAGEPDAPGNDSLLIRTLAVPAGKATATRQRAKRVKGGLFAIALTAFALTFSDRLAGQALLYSTFACRENTFEESVIGALSNLVALALPAPDGTLEQYIARLRRELIETLAVQRMPPPLPDGEAYAGPTADSLTVSVQFLPAAMIGAGSGTLRIGEADVRRHGMALCPSGCDLDLYLLDQPIAPGAAHQGEFALAAMADPGRVGARRLATILDAWREALEYLSTVDWSGTAFLDACRAVGSVCADGKGGST